MKHGNFKFLPVLFLAVLFMASWAHAETSLDPPHDSVTNCTNCHYSSRMSEPSYGLIDNTPYNYMCWDCHNAAQEGSQAAHSSDETNTENKYGIWTYECRDCHNPHYQRQMRLYPEDYPQGSTLFKGLVNSLETNLIVNDTLTLRNPDNSLIYGWTQNQWADYIIQPNTDYPYFYRITNSSTDGNVTVSKEILETYYWLVMVEQGSNFRIGYPRLISEEIATKRSVANIAGTPLNTNAWRPAKFFNSTGDYSLESLATSEQKSDMICIVCHLQTKVNNYGFTEFGSDYDVQQDGGTTVTVADYGDHKVGDEPTCFSNVDGCHKGHDSGFQRGGAECGTCHGGTDGMTSPTHLVTNTLEGGTLLGRTTGGSLWGHPKHLSYGGLGCKSCHLNGMNPSATLSDIGDYYIDMQFSADETNPLSPAGTYGGRSSLTDNFAYNGPSFGPAGVGDGSMECRNLYCHSNAGEFDGTGFVYQTPVWSDTPIGGLDCNDCHGDSGVATPEPSDYVLTSKHPKHVANSPGNYDYSCNTCHAATVNSANAVINNSVHVDGTKTISFSGLAAGAGWTRNPDGECSNLYCHSPGTSTSNPPAPNTAALWNSPGGLGCDDCHNAAGDTHNNVWSAPHNEHLELYSGRFSCNACHNEVTGDGASISNTSLHVNQQANVDINTTDYGALALYNTSLPIDTCENVKCHSTGQPGIGEFVDATWNAGQGCDYCHEAARATEAAMALGNALSVSHWAHVANGAGEYGYPARIANAITCGSCHSGTTDDGLTINQGGFVANHVNFSNDVAFEFTNINATATGNYQAGMTCTNVYCHGVSMPYGSDTGTGDKGLGEKGQDLAPTWSNTAYIDGADPANDCKMCHGFPPKGYTGVDGLGNPDTHTKTNTSTGLQNCTGCHQHVSTSSPYFSDITKHINGQVEAADCEGCHGQPPTSQANIINNPDYTGMTAGAHQRHLDVEKAGCDNCHLGGAGSSSHLVTDINAVTMGFANYLSPNAVYQGSSAMQNTFFTNSGDANTNVNSAVDATRTCASIYCHSDGGNYDLSSFVGRTADWDDSYSYPGDCDQCHGDGNGTGGNYVLTTLHPKHVGGGAGQYSYACDLCHTLTVSGMGIIDNSIHSDGIKNVAFSTDALTTGGGWAKPDCNSVYCHSDGVTAPGPGQAAWNDSPTGACGTCHGVRNDDGGPTSTTHDKHVLSTSTYEFECIKCHDGIVTGTGSSSVTPDITDTSLHVDGIRNAVLNTTDTLVGSSAGWNGSNCSNVYCHSDGHTFGGASVAYGTAAWSGAGWQGDCTDCHNDPPATDRHGRHVSDYTYECFECHGDTVDGNNLIIGNHVNNTPDVAWGNISSGGDAYGSAGTGRCANIYCHGDGDGGAGVQTADWDLPATGECGDCHGVDSLAAANIPASPTHIAHVNASATGNSYMYECGTCHNTIVPHTVNSTVAPSSVLDQAVHVDGIKNVILHTANGNVGGSANWNLATGACSTTYCHGGDVARSTFGGGADTAPTWSNTGYIDESAAPDVRCGKCHGTPPDLGSHASQGYSLAGDDCVTCHNHMNAQANWATLGPWNKISLHINGAPDGGCTGCHGQPPVDLNTIVKSDYTLRQGQNGWDAWGAHSKHYGYKTAFEDCYICHKGGGNEEASHPDDGVSLEIHMGFTYPAASDNPAAQYSAPAIANASYSIVNTITTTTVGSGAARECSNIYCHSDGGNFAGSSFVYQTPDWDRATSFSYPTDCDQCHGDGTGSGVYVESTLHPTHANQYGFDCELCHNTVVDAGMNILSNSIHVDGIKNVIFNGTNALTTGGDWSGRPACDTIYCHSQGTSTYAAPNSTPNWDGSGTWNGDCSDCHGGDSGATSTIGSGAHTPHVNDGGVMANATCDACHVSTTSDGSTITGTSLHVNVTNDVTIAAAWDDASAVPGDNYSGSATKTCSNVYCHSTGQRSGSITYYDVAWTDTPPGDCTFCHGTNGRAGNDGTGADLTSAHGAHFTGSTYGCTDCHNTVASSDTGISGPALHVNGLRNVVMNSTYGGSYSDAGQTCSSVACHGSTTPAWDSGFSATYDKCTMCHGQATAGGTGTASEYLMAPPSDIGGGSQAIGMHQAHLNTTSNLGISFNVVCSECHADADQLISTGNVQRSGHINDGSGTAEVSFASATRADLQGLTPSYSSLQCSSTYCHGNAMPKGSRPGADPAPTWTNTSYLTGSYTPSGDCGMCHESPPRDPGGALHSGGHTAGMNPSAGDCSGCHPATVNSDGSIVTSPNVHINGQVEADAGDSSGGGACGGCHSELFNSDPGEATMHGSGICTNTAYDNQLDCETNLGTWTTFARINYKHYMNNAEVDNPGSWTQGGLSYYPEDVTSSSTDDVDISPTNDAKRRCLMCHVDHDIFRKDLNPNSPGRAYNLRTTIQVAPNNTPGNGPGNAGKFTNTDFDASQTDGGICLSCHFKERTKYLQTPNNATKTPPIPFPLRSGSDATDLSRAKDLMVRSTHNYAVNGTIFNGPDGDDSPMTRFQAVCLKCHNDSIGQNWGPKTKVEAQMVNGTCYGGTSDGTETTSYECFQKSGIWNGEPAFGRHISSNDSSLAVLGTLFEQGFVNGGVANDWRILYRDPKLPAWKDNQWVGYQVVITNGAGQHSRSLVIQQNAPDWLQVASDFYNIPDGSSQYDIVKSPLPQDDLCFSCHSKNRQNKNVRGDLWDWYDQEPMKEILTRMKDIFVGDQGVNRDNSGQNDDFMYVCSDKDLTTADVFKGYTYKSGTTTLVVSASGITSSDSTCAGLNSRLPNVYQLTFTGTVSNNQLNAGVSFKLFKPAVHPLDKFGRHQPYERVTATTGWNMGDEGTITTEVASGPVSTITDSSKSWVPDQWTADGADGTPNTGDGESGEDMYFYIQSGANLGESPKLIASNTRTTITLASGQELPNGVAVGDQYYIGAADDARHVSCADCHNTHASTHNPEGELDVADITATTSLSNRVASDDAYAPFWSNGEWVGHVLKLRKSKDHPTYPGLEQLRYVSGFTLSGGVGEFEVSLPWRVNPENPCKTTSGGTTNQDEDACLQSSNIWAPDHFELDMGTRWTASGQEGGLAGSGSTGVWGVMAINTSSWPTPTSGALITNTQLASSLDWDKVENVFDKSGTYGGHANTGQRDLCVRCHSYYAYRTARPNTPSEGADPTSDMSPRVVGPALETDVVAEFNPKNMAHHAVYARGNNQPISPTGETASVSAFNGKWPALGTDTGLMSGNDHGSYTVDIDTSGVVTFNSLSGGLPETVLPGWYLYISRYNGDVAPTSGANEPGWFQVVTVDNMSQVTVEPAPSTGQSGSAFRLTSGLGNTFVPPYGPWSILRCSDCHGSTKTDPVGPHASVNTWLLKDLDTEMQFEWFNGSSVVMINPGNANAQHTNSIEIPDLSYICFNCHRRDVYLDAANWGDATTPTTASEMGRMAHGSKLDNGSRTDTVDGDLTFWPQHCRICHAGDKLGGIHGTNALPSNGNDSKMPNEQGKRFLNGSSWNGYGAADQSGDGKIYCYTNSSANSVDGCASHGTARSMAITPRYTYW